MGVSKFRRGNGTPSQSVIIAVILLISVRGTALAQPPVPDPADAQARIERLERELRELKESLQRQTAAPAPTADPETVSQMVDQYLKDKATQEQTRTKVEDERKKQEGIVVGDDRKLNATWDNGGFRFKTADEAFSAHIGGRLMTDEVWWTQSPNLRKAPTQPAGTPLPVQTGVGVGIGDLMDGFFVRRARVVADGTVFQTIEFKTEFDFENYNNISFDESYIGAKDLPFIDTVRFGQTHVPFGLEAYTSSRFLPMLERSPLFDAFYQEFAPGIFQSRTFFDKHMTMQHMFHRIDNFSQFNGASFGDGKYAYSGRVSFLPIDEDEGRRLLHLGVAYQFRKGSIPSDFNGGTTLASTPVTTDNTDLVRFRTRPSIRDAVGLQGLATRFVDTGNIIADDVQAVNLELMGYLGPLWVQSEACVSHVDNAFFPASNLATSRGNLDYYGSYVQVGYFLTGENRGYDRRFGKYDRVVPLENFFLVHDENGHSQWGLGAWEIQYRYGFVNLNDDLIRGGTYSEHTVGLNWYWTSNIKFQMNYINGQRTVVPSAVSGNVQGFAIRGALEF